MKKRCGVVIILQLGPLEDKVREVLEDQATRSGQVLKLSEKDTKERYPKLVVASLGAQRKD